MPEAEGFDEWYARCHPFDWYAKECGEPIPTAVRLHIWHMCRSAWLHEELTQRSAPTNSGEGR